MSAKTNAMRVLDARDVPYQVVEFPPDIHSAKGVAEAADVPEREVYKTLVTLRPGGRPALVMLAADRELDLKALAAALDEKKMRMAGHDEAETLTGLQVGGISALALLGKGIDVCLDRRADDLAHIVISAGQRGLNLRLRTDDLVRLTEARLVDASRPPHGA